jgi:hypothetical protein
MAQTLRNAPFILWDGRGSLDETEGRNAMRALILSLAIGLASLGLTALTPSPAQADHWHGGWYGGYYPARYWHGGSHYRGWHGWSHYRGGSYPAYRWPGWSHYRGGYWPGYASYYWSPGYYNPGYTFSYGYSPFAYSSYYSPGLSIWP